jgi:hypothetical protein
MVIDFLGIGAQKSGTSWLYANLKRHPAVFIPDAKELHYWDQHHHRGLDWYLSHFQGAPEGCRRGEITPAYGILTPDMVAEVRRLFPEVRLFFIMRNPVERAWSAVQMALRHADMTIDEASDRWFFDFFASKRNRMRGDYLSCLKTWAAAFPADQMMWLLFDDLVRDPRAMLGRVCGHIGADAGWVDSVPDEVLRQKVLEGQGHAMRPALRDHLVRQYAGEIDALEHYLGADLSAWKAANQPVSLAGRLKAMLR